MDDELQSALLRAAAYGKPYVHMLELQNLTKPLGDVAVTDRSSCEGARENGTRHVNTARESFVNDVGQRSALSNTDGMQDLHRRGKVLNCHPSNVHTCTVALAQERVHTSTGAYLAAPIHTTAHQPICTQMLPDSFMPAVPAGAFLTEAFLSACRISRVLRAIRSANVGLLLTRAQFNAHGASASDWLISRLMVQHAHLLAMRVSEQLGLSSLQATVVLHWAKAKIGAVATLSDEELLGVVVPKVRTSRLAARCQRPCAQKKAAS